MKLVIEIPEEDYNNLKIGCTQRVSDGEMIEAIKNGIPLFKGHGRLIDADSLDIPVDICDGFEAMDYIDGADTIIEADKENKE